MHTIEAHPPAMDSLSGGGVLPSGSDATTVTSAFSGLRCETGLASHAPASGWKKTLRGALNPARAICRINSQDLRNKLRYGWAAPVARERIWIDPRAVTRCIPHPTELGVPPTAPDYEISQATALRTWKMAGKVIGDEVDTFRLRPLSDLQKIQICKRHWIEGSSWEEAGAIDNLLFKIAAVGVPVSECATRADILRRYERLDIIFEEVRRTGALRSMQRRKGLFQRESDGVQIHLGRGGEPIFGETGTHRLAIALVLGLPCIPASLGFVHESALALLPSLRRRPDHDAAAPHSAPRAPAPESPAFG